MMIAPAEKARGHHQFAVNKAAEHQEPCRQLTHIGRPGKGAGPRVGLPALSGGVGRELDDEVGIEGCADSLQQGNRGNYPAGFQA
jgi:hypothetical protein